MLSFFYCQYNCSVSNAIEIEELLKTEEEMGVHGYKWAVRVRKMIKYRDDHGHCNVPQKHSSLGN